MLLTNRVSRLRHRGQRCRSVRVMHASSSSRGFEALFYYRQMVPRCFPSARYSFPNSHTAIPARYNREIPMLLQQSVTDADRQEHRGSVPILFLQLRLQ